ncbi:MAG: MFS transporter, partial [Actinobacteria bacterium]|nr:MFS transporter [Actinomycetota bacterium]
MASQTAQIGPPNPRRWKSLAAICMLIGLVWVLSDGFVIVVPSIGRDLGGTTDQMAWAVNAFALTACFAALFGRLGDMRGNRRILTAGCLILILGSVVGGLAESPNVLILARVLQGSGGGAIFTCGLSLVTLEFPPDERSKALSIRAAFGWAASGLAVFILAVLLETLGWRSTFWAAIPVALIGLGLAAATTPDISQRKPGERLDVVGAVFLTSAILVLSYALIESDELGTTELVSLIAAAVLLIGAFTAVESRVGDPLIPMSVWRHQTFSGSIIVNFIFTGVLMGLLYLLALYLQTVRGLNTIEAAVLLLGATIAVIVTNPFGAGLVKRGRYLLPVVAGMVLLGVGCITVLIGIRAHINPVLLLGLVLLGSAVGVQLTSISTLQVSSAGASKGTAAGIVGVTFGVSTAMGVALATAIMENVALSELAGETGSNELEGVSHQQLLDILTGSLPLDSISSAGQKVVVSAFDQGLMVTSAAF